MRRILPLFIVLYLFSTSLEAQTKKDIDKQLKEAGYTLDFVDAEKGLKIILQAREASKHIGYEEGIVKSGHMLTVYYMRKDDYKKVIDTSYEVEALALEHKNYTVLSDIYRMRALSHGQLGLSKPSYEEYLTALEASKKIQKKNTRHYKTSLIYSNMITYFDQMDDNHSQDSILYYLKKSLEEIKQIEEPNPDVKLNDKYDMLAGTNSNIGMFYINQHEPQRIDLAERYFLDAIAIYNNKKYKLMAINRVLLSNSFGRFYHAKKDYSNTIKYATNALELEKKANSPYMRQEAYEMLLDSYLEIGDKSMSKKYMQLFTNINDSINAVENARIEAPVDRIVSQEKKKHTTTILIIAGCIIIIIAFAIRFFWKRKNRILHKNYEVLVQKLRTEKKTGSLAEETNDNSKPLTDKSFNIIEETVDALLLKLEKFEKSKNIIKKDVSLTWLANHLNTNTRYLSEVIKKHKGKSFSNYINSLRINYIVELLYEEPKHREYKISYLAELCGFSSREVFTTTFKKETGISPSYFLDNLKNEIDITDEQEKHKIV
ncbi:helix-turn-helix domain-containing protein [Flavobacterium cerinum]|uniref:Helix-turn-helix domain-containing protein n=1 Tax=Flavobacterium cerinum TaxID=2502784 RepID=A0A444H094_9FLAO|nr:helix-turn-helix domain-containing protein [Flavobacterium cerinum]RWW96756.1 helix-turn-helix domain-containing protein [Flavobacterium cerinum]